MEVYDEGCSESRGEPLWRIGRGRKRSRVKRDFWTSHLIRFITRGLTFQQNRTAGAFLWAEEEKKPTASLLLLESQADPWLLGCLNVSCLISLESHLNKRKGLQGTFACLFSNDRNLEAEAGRQPNSQSDGLTSRTNNTEHLRDYPINPPHPFSGPRYFPPWSKLE